LGKHFLFHFANAVPGREAEFNAWYDDTHLGDVLAVPGMIAATRYELEPIERSGPPAPAGYVAVYEFEGEPSEVLPALSAASKKMVISDAMSRERGPSHVYKEITRRRLAADGGDTDVAETGVASETA
jgi:hypothetical protein